MTAGRWFKLACVVLYAAIVAGMTGWVYLRTARGPHTKVGPHTKLARALVANQYITDADLRSVDQAAISGHYARNAKEVGATIGPADVLNKPDPSPEPTLALQVSMLRPPSGAAIVKGDEVRLCLDDKEVAPNTGKVGASLCGATFCLLSIPLAALPKSLEAPGAAARVKAIPPTSRCEHQ